MNDGWQCVSPESAGLDPNLIQQLFERIDDGTFKNVHSVLVVRDGRIAVEKYWAGKDREGQFQTFTADTLHELHSVTKSVNSVLVGIAIGRRLIGGVDDKVSDFFPEYSDVFADEVKRTIGLRHLLSMSAGLAWDEWSYAYSDPRNDAATMARQADSLRYLLEKPMEASPGQKFVYNSGASLLLGEIVRRVSGMSVDGFAERYLFSPLGITNFLWQKTAHGLVNTYGGLRLRSRDMAKIGQLFLDGGRWQGEQIVTPDWIKEATKPQVCSGQFPRWAKADCHGYQWWPGFFEVGATSYGSYSARGRGGQYIIVVPELQMVVVVTSWNGEVSLLGQPLEMVQRFVVPAATFNRRSAI